MERASTLAGNVEKMIQAGALRRCRGVGCYIHLGSNRAYHIAGPLVCTLEHISAFGDGSPLRMAKNTSYARRPYDVFVQGPERTLGKSRRAAREYVDSLEVQLGAPSEVVRCFCAWSGN